MAYSKNLSYSLLFLFFLSWSTAWTQNNTITITDLKPKHNDNRFPEVQDTQNPKVAEKINTFLQLEYLEHLPGVFKKHPFELVSYDRPNREMGGSKGFESWKKEPAPKNVLSITLNADFTGAYSEEYQIHHNYDSRTGNVITLSLLIKKELQKKLAQLLNDKAKKRVNDFLIELKKDSTAIDSIADREAFDMYTEQVNMYTNCINDDYPYALEDHSFYFSKDSLHIIRERCSAHVNRALDDLWEFDFRFSYTEMEPYFSPYGKNLLANSPDIAKTNSPEGKLYKGKIGSYPITLLIQNSNTDGSVTVQYWYDKHKIPIEWDGHYADHHFSLQEEVETPDAFETLAKIEANWSNGKITGTWTNVKTKKVLPLEVTEY
ncbi:hypothetical protein [Flavobacterium sp.]|uniref:hypothetical protein n=1 Tax=Flavobacterium sp. TaxID=239 RepID=UPI002FDA4699